MPGGQTGRFVPESESGQPIVSKRDHNIGLSELTVGESDSGGDVELT